MRAGRVPRAASAIALASLLMLGLPGSSSAASRSVVVGVTVIDGRGGPPLPGRNVVIENGRIVRIEDASRPAPSPGQQTIEGAGRFLIPGLFNMHVHCVSYEEARKAFPRLLAGGVTGIRDMGAPFADVLRLRRETQDGTLLGPRMVVAGPLLQGPLPARLAALPLLRASNSPAEAIEAVRSLRASGVDFIKLGDPLPRVIFDAIASEARRLGIPFAGHVSVSVGAVAASDAGQRSIEHLGPHHAVLLACSRREAELRAQLRALLDDVLAAAFRGEEPDERALFRSALSRALLDSYDESKAGAVFQRFVENDTWQVPTLVALQRLWKRGDLDPDNLRDGKRIVERERAIVGSMSRAGVKLMAGSDGPLGDAASALYEELELLVRSGLTPMQALGAATRNPAEFLGRLDSLGTIEPGKLADLVLLEGDPSKDIRNVRRIVLVLVGGERVPRFEGKD